MMAKIMSSLTKSLQGKQFSCEICVFRIQVQPCFKSQNVRSVHKLDSKIGKSLIFALANEENQSRYFAIEDKFRKSKKF